MRFQGFELYGRLKVGVLQKTMPPFVPHERYYDTRELLCWEVVLCWGCSVQWTRKQTLCSSRLVLRLHKDL